MSLNDFSLKFVPSRKKHTKNSWMKCIMCGITNHTMLDKRNFYRFPKDPERCRQWIAAVGHNKLRSLSPNALYKRYRICSLHFDECSFSSSKRKLLTATAAPCTNIKNVRENKDQDEIFQQLVCPRISRSTDIQLRG
ncbi:uncharacterized protein [Parasteatoda tepidariorum]|uniref:uncharacterized protein n=1 Tax=Parasteatoda tepidariorum TaxID=114398 RepID=UPI0039BCD4BD